MRNYIVSYLSEYDSGTDWMTEDKTPEEVMMEYRDRYLPYYYDITIMEVDTLEVNDTALPPGDVFEDFLLDGVDGDTDSGITRIAMWQVVPSLEKA